MRYCSESPIYKSLVSIRRHALHSSSHHSRKLSRRLSPQPTYLPSSVRFRCFVGIEKHCRPSCTHQRPGDAASPALFSYAALGGHHSGKRESESSRRTTYLHKAGPVNSLRQGVSQRPTLRQGTPASRAAGFGDS